MWVLPTNGMMGINVHKAREAFNIPDDFEVDIIISIESKTESIDTQRKKISIRDCISRRVRLGILSSDTK